VVVNIVRLTKNVSLPMKLALLARSLEKKNVETFPVAFGAKAKILA